MENCLKLIKKIKKQVVKVCPHCEIEITKENHVKFIKLYPDSEIIDDCFQCNNCDGFYEND